MRYIPARKYPEIVYEKKYHVYCLACPITMFPIYIGRTKNPHLRRASHINKAKTRSNDFNEWHINVTKKGYSPIMIILRSTNNYFYCARLEKKYIKLFSKMGHKLFNKKYNESN